MSIQLVIFDLDNTLVDRATVFRKWARDYAARRQLPAGAAAQLEEFDANGYAPRLEFAHNACTTFELGTTEEQFLAEYEHEYIDYFEPNPELLARLKRISESGTKLGIATNGPARQEHKIRSCGLDVVVDAWAISAVDGIWKPEPGLLQLVADRAGVALASSIMVGDHANDIEAAAAAGIPSIWVNRDYQWVGSDVMPTVSCDTIFDAFDELDRRLRVS